jgi:hypothetical protein
LRESLKKSFSKLLFYKIDLRTTPTPTVSSVVANHSNFQSEYRINQIFSIFVTKPFSMVSLKRLNQFVGCFAAARITTEAQRASSAKLNPSEQWESLSKVINPIAGELLSSIARFPFRFILQK